MNIRFVFTAMYISLFIHQLIFAPFNELQDTHLAAYGFRVKLEYEKRWICQSSGFAKVEFENIC